MKMKNLFIAIFAVVFTTGLTAQIDRTKAPAAGPAQKIQLGDYETFTLANGMQVFLVENHKVPKVSWQLYINRDEVSNPENAGMQDLMGQLLMTGTTSKTKAQLDESIDFIGASLSTSSYGAYASSLTKHAETTLALMSDVIMNPTFPQEELDKLKTQTLSGLAANASDPGAISSNVSSILKYGKDHPYGQIETTETVETVNAEMCKAFYNTYFKPNISYMIVVGDIDKKTAEAMLTKNFGSWSKGDVPTHTYDVPVAPQATQVAFVNKPGAVQSTININYPVNLKPGAEDLMAARVMNAILGSSGFMARLIQNIREDKAYTYGAYSSLSSDELVGSFYAGAEVRNEVTDSAIVEFLMEMDRLTKEKVSDEELQNTKNYLNGQFARGLERPSTVARFALNTARYNLPADYYATYLERLQAVTADDVMAAAKKYLTTGNAYILVVGNKAEVANNLKRFAASGKVDYYDAYGNPVADAEPIPEGVTVTTVMDAFYKGMGGKEALAAIHSQNAVFSSSMQGMPITFNIASSGTDKYSMVVKANTPNGEMVVNQITVNGSKGKMSGMMGAKDLTEEEVADYAQETTIFEELTITEANAKLVLIEEFNGEKAYKMEVTDKNGNMHVNYYSVATGLKVGSISTEETPQGPMTSTTMYGNYQPVNNIPTAHSITSDNAGQVMEMKLESLEYNGKIDASVFAL
jgi:predicted Zn-dependent peptidase